MKTAYLLAAAIALSAGALAYFAGYESGYEKAVRRSAGGQATPPSSPKAGAPRLIRACPDAWYRNEMPRVISGSNTEDEKEYFIFNGKRAEKRDFDVEWITKNCQVKAPQAVY